MLRKWLSPILSLANFLQNKHGRNERKRAEVEAKTEKRGGCRLQRKDIAIEWVAAGPPAVILRISDNRRR